MLVPQFLRLGTRDNKQHLHTAEEGDSAALYNALFMILSSRKFAAVFLCVV